ncbi:hypothetical protein TeGR_g15132, partial [Tetraparma gracilis]
MELLQNQHNDGLDNLRLTFCTALPALDAASPPTESSFLPAPQHTYFPSSPPCDYRELLRDVRHNTFTGPTHLIIRTAPTITHNAAISNCVLVSSSPPLSLRSNPSLRSSFLHSCSVFSAAVGAPALLSPAAHPQSILAVPIGAESGGARIIYVDTSLGCSSNTTSIPALFDQFLTFERSTPPPPPSRPPTFTDLYDCVLFPGSSCASTASLTSSILHPRSSVSSCLAVASATLFSDASASACSSLSLLVLAPHASAAACTSRNTFVSSHSSLSAGHVSEHVILGPSSHLSCGEAHASLLGPLTNQHHQSLLISTIAPAGRVNVGYGCNCGSNHTGRAADQECFLGEGVFLGLATAIKFPFNLALAPYTLVATGVMTRGAVGAFPFSLIAEPNDSLRFGDKKGGASPPPLANQLHPGWLLTASMYVKRAL